MRVIIVSETRFSLGPNNNYIALGTINEIFLKRYKDVFSGVMAAGRIRHGISGDYHNVEADSISVVPLPDYNNATGFLKSFPGIYRRLSGAIAESDVVIGRIPGPIGSIAMFIGKTQGKVVAAEVVADPWDAFGAGAVNAPMRPLLRIALTLIQKIVCSFAHGTAYVTSEALQSRYPPGRLTASYSSIELDDEWILNSSEVQNMPRMSKQLSTTWVITFVGSLAQMYKGPDILLKAIQMVKLKGLDLEAHIVGDGRMRNTLEVLSQNLGIADAITFHGHIARSGVRDILDKSDLFILPSRQEGLPRSIIEAMSRGLPVIGTTVGGIPELLQPVALVRPDDPQALSDRIYEFITNKELFRRMSVVNIIRAKDYTRSELQPRRVQFYQALANLVNK